MDAIPEVITRRIRTLQRQAEIFFDTFVIEMKILNAITQS